MQCKITAKNGSLYLSTSKAYSFIIRQGSHEYVIFVGTNNRQRMKLNKQQARSLCLNLLEMFPDIQQAIKTKHQPLYSNKKER